jgi:hypothetical protein
VGTRGFRPVQPGTSKAPMDDQSPRILRCQNIPHPSAIFARQSPSRRSPFRLFHPNTGGKNCLVLPSLVVCPILWANHQYLCYPAPAPPFAVIGERATCFVDPPVSPRGPGAQPPCSPPTSVTPVAPVSRPLSDPHTLCRSQPCEPEKRNAPFAHLLQDLLSCHPPISLKDHIMLTASIGLDS